MCGIVGVVGKRGEKLFALFESLLKIDVLRGEDSTGVAFIDRKKTIVVKDTVLPSELIADKDYSEAKKGMSYKGYICLIGHNRFATKGAISPELAHPFTKGHIVMAHNGTIRNQSGLIDNRKFESDSENIAHSIE